MATRPQQILERLYRMSLGPVLRDGPRADCAGHDPAPARFYTEYIVSKREGAWTRMRRGPALVNRLPRHRGGDTTRCFRHMFGQAYARIRRMPNPGQPTISTGAAGDAVRRLQRALRRI